MKFNTDKDAITRNIINSFANASICNIVLAIILYFVFKSFILSLIFIVLNFYLKSRMGFHTFQILVNQFYNKNIKNQDNPNKKVNIIDILYTDNYPRAEMKDFMIHIQVIQIFNFALITYLIYNS